MTITPQQTTNHSRTVSVPIARAWHDVYAFVSLPENFTRWAAGLAKSLHKDEDEWHADGPAGPVRIRFSEPNDFGIVDHYVMPSAGGEIYVPMRVIANGNGAEVMLTVFQGTGMSEEQLAVDVQAVERDLRTLKALLEAHAQ